MTGSAGPPSPPTIMADGVPSASSKAARLAELTIKARQKYLVKDYGTAADLYAQATEIQAEMNGELANQNAELLYLYGQSLYQVGVNSSDILGETVGGEDQASNSNAGKRTPTVIEAVAAAMERRQAGPSGATSGDQDSRASTSNPNFHFTGDEAWGSDGEEATAGDDDGGGDDEGDAEAAKPEPEEEEDDDFILAWENLDLARLLFERSLKELEEESARKENEVVDSAAKTRHLNERLADTHDLLAEISLEHENFESAVHDFRASLSLKRILFPLESEIIAEAHYKLSLALEFAAIKRDPEQASSSVQPKQIEYNKEVRQEAVEQMEAAIASTKARVEKEEAILTSGSENDRRRPDGRLITKAGIEDVKEIITDMEQRVSIIHPGPPHLLMLKAPSPKKLADDTFIIFFQLVDLRKPPSSVEAVAESAAFTDGSHPLSGVLGTLLGVSAEERQAKIEEAMQGANDLSGLVRRNTKPTIVANIKKVTPPAESLESNPKAKVNDNGKRKAEGSVNDQSVVDVSGIKKAKVEDALD